ncbi:DNA-directed RNA polymerases II, IV and V subunit 9B [Zea mays]|uniref:DNA-directed RNA polymerases II, IV and V subunit 9B n=1 Tax=Zea mays TaxID=4577 RepID=A0A3L6E187_MAIZE|nr:DNA-directed RNA polymerases II, IV and V subunit 9B [Zea mays]
MNSMASATGVSSSEMAVDHATGPGAVEKPRFDALTPNEMSGGRPQFRKVPVPQHRFARLKRCWMEIYKPVYEHMKIDIRMNLKKPNASELVSGTEDRVNLYNKFHGAIEAAHPGMIKQLELETESVVSGFCCRCQEWRNQILNLSFTTARTIDCILQIAVKKLNPESVQGLQDWQDNMENFNPFGENGEQGTWTVILVRLLRFWDYQNTDRGYTVYFDFRTAKCLYCLKAVFILVYYLPNVSVCLIMQVDYPAYVHNSSNLHMTASFFSLLDSFHFCPLGYKDFPDLGNTTSSLLSTCCHVVLELWYNWSWVKATWSLEVEVSDNNCVYRNEVHHTAGERTQVLQDVASDPTLPRTKAVRCNLCGHGEVVFFQQSDICISVVAIDGTEPA